jgi:hypothetical protein
MVALFMVFLIGCRAQPAAPTPESDEASPAVTTETEPYPAETPATESYPEPMEEEGYPGPQDAAPSEEYPLEDTEDNASGSVEQGSPEPFVIPTPSSSEVGIVTGTLLRLAADSDAVEPITSAVLYLGPVVETTEGVEGLVSLDRGTDSRAELTSQGNFAFTDVTPDRYGLWMVPPSGNALLLKQPETGEDMIIEVNGGEVIELGELRYELPETL